MLKLQVLGIFKKNRIDLFSIGIVSLYIISILNLIVVLSGHEPLFKIITHVLPYVLGAVITEFMRKNKQEWWPGILSLAISINMLFGTVKYTGMAFFIFGLHIIKNIKSRICICVAQIFIIIFYNSHNGKDLNYLLTMIFAYALATTVYFILTYEKKPESVIPDMDATDKLIFSLMVAGKTYKEIGYSIGLSADAVRKRVNRIKQKLGFDNNEQMVYNLTQRGFIRPKTEELSV